MLKDILKNVKSLEDLVILTKGVTKTLEHDGITCLGKKYLICHPLNNLLPKILPKMNQDLITFIKEMTYLM